MDEKDGIQNAIDDAKRYEYAAFAGHLAQSKEGQQFIPGALEKLLSSLSEDAALSTNVAIKRGGEKEIIDIYSRKYQTALNFATIEEYLKEEGINLETAKNKFGGFFDQTYGNIIEKIEGAKYIISGEKEGKYKFLEEEKEKAKKDIKEYGGIFLLINQIQNRKFEKLRGEIASENYDKLPDEIMKDPEKYVNQVFAEYLNGNYEEPGEEPYEQAK